MLFDVIVNVFAPSQGLFVAGSMALSLRNKNNVLSLKKDYL